MQGHYVGSSHFIIICFVLLKTILVVLSQIIRFFLKKNPMVLDLF